MKKLFLTVILLFCITAFSLFAWEPSDLMEYPSFTEAGDWILNLGVGFNGDLLGGLQKGKDYYHVPPVRLSFDRNVPLGDNDLPFFFGGVLGYAGRGYKGSGKHYFNSDLNAGFRFGYHFNWDVDKLDTYAVTTAGYKFYLGDKDHIDHPWGWPDIGISLGARFFPLDWFGFWVEVGAGSYLFNADIGISFKF